MPGTLRLTNHSAVPIDVASLFTGAIDARSWSDLPSRSIRLGGNTLLANELFEFSGDASDGQLTLEGNLARAIHIGAEMTSGHIVVRSDAGPNLGRGLAGGVIEVHGSVGNFAGVGMSGGEIAILGNAGNELGSGEPGSPGMTGGAIYVRGHAGHFAGRRMRRGLIAIGGSVGVGAMTDAIAGTMIVQGASGECAGVGMRRGTLLLLQPPTAPLLPTFVVGRVIEPLFLSILLRQWRHDRMPMDPNWETKKFVIYHGDLSQRGLGEILIPSE